MNWDVVVVGAGAAGLVAAERAALRGRKTLLLEKNRKPGVKILMSGGTRCNLTHATDVRGIVTAYGPPGRVLHSALAALSPHDLVVLVEGEGVATKVEETGKIFPVSNRATDVLAAFVRRLARSGCELALGEPLVELGAAIEDSSSKPRRAACRPNGSSSRPVGNRIPPAARPARDMPGRRNSGMRSFRRGLRSCPLRFRSRGFTLSRGLPSRTSYCD